MLCYYNKSLEYHHSQKSHKIPIQFLLVPTFRPPFLQNIRMLNFTQIRTVAVNDINSLQKKKQPLVPNTFTVIIFYSEAYESIRILREEETSHFLVDNLLSGVAFVQISNCNILFVFTNCKEFSQKAQWRIFEEAMNKIINPC